MMVPVILKTVTWVQTMVHTVCHVNLSLELMLRSKTRNENLIILTIK